MTYKHNRTDINFGGPIGNGVRYHVGGFYRASNGIRSPGYTGDLGGQIKANLTYRLNTAYLRVYAKYLNDRTVSYVNAPLQQDFKAIAGFDPLFNTLASPAINRIQVPKPGGNQLTAALEDGIHPKLLTIGGELTFVLSDEWLFTNKSKRTIINSVFNGIFPTRTLADHRDFAGTVFGPNPSFSYTYATGAAAGTPADLGVNGLVGEYGWWHVATPLRDFTTVFSLARSINEHDFELGYYFSNSDVAGKWQWQNLLADISKSTRPLNLTNLATGISYTQDGWSDYGAFYNNYRFDTDVNALFFNAKLTPTPAFNLDIGLRYENGKMNGWVEETDSFDLGDASTTADDNVQYGTGSFSPVAFDYNVLAISFGWNYRLSASTAIFGRASKGFRAPDDMNFTGGLNEHSPNGLSSTVDVENIYQYDLGIKYSKARMAFFSTLFYSSFDRIPFSDFIQDFAKPGDYITLNEIARSVGYGIENELALRLNDFFANSLIFTLLPVTVRNVSL